MTNLFDSFSAKRAANLSGFNTVAMLDYLQRAGVFHPRGTKGGRGRGKRRSYEFRDVLVLKAIKRLLDAGASVSSLSKALSEFQKTNWSADPVTLEDAHGVVRYLVASGDDIYLAKDADVLINLSKKGQLAFSFIIDIDVLWQELRAGLGLKSVQRELSLEGGSAGS
jgi:DNA-binding transcriptional MerR regulator